MRVARVLACLVVASLGVTELSAQIPTRRRPTEQAQANAPRLLVANPYSFVAQDSLASVQVGEGLRTRMDKVVGSSYNVLSRQQMNDALRQFGYPPDALLSAPVQRTFANTMQAKHLVSSTLHRQGGRLVLTARFAGINDEAGNVVVMAQEQGQDLPALGVKAADAFSPAVKSQSEAKACIDQRATAPAKASAAAKKALEEMPKNGLAHYCMAMLALDKKTKADSAEALKHLQEAVGGDPLSLAAWTALAAQYEVREDTARTVEALKQMLVVAPTNQPLREQVFKILLQKYNLPDAAEQAAEDGLKIDPTNADLWDLLSNARVFKGDFAGAVDALEQVVVNDSTKADSTFYLKITVMASQKPDTTRFLKWARRGEDKYPNNLELLKLLVQAYALTSETDSLVTVTSRLMKVDTASVPQALAAAQALQNLKRFKDADPFLEYAFKYGDPQQREAVTGLMLNAALPLLQPDTSTPGVRRPPDWVAAAEALRRVTRIGDSTGKFYPIASYYLGLSLVQQIAVIDPQAEKQKSCDLANQESALVAEAEPAIVASGNYQPEQAPKLLAYLNGLKPRVASMIKVYCKGGR